MKTILTGIIATTIAISVNAQVQETQTTTPATQAQSENMNSTSRSGMDDYSWDPVYTQHMSDYERGLNSDYGLLMGRMNLTEDQKNQLKKISDNSRMQMMDLYRNTDLANDQVRQKHQSIINDRRTQINAILTADQRKQYETWYASNPSKMSDINWRTEWLNDNMSLEKMRTQLSLTDDQFNKLQAMEAGYNDKKMAILNNTSLTADQRREQMKALHLERRTTMRALLNADQVKKIRVENDGDVKIKTQEGNKTQKIKTKGGTGSGNKMNSSNGSTNRSSSGTMNSNNSNRSTGTTTTTTTEEQRKTIGTSGTGGNTATAPGKPTPNSGTTNQTTTNPTGASTQPQ